MKLDLRGAWVTERPFFWLAVRQLRKGYERLQVLGFHRQKQLLRGGVRNKLVVLAL